MGTVTKQYLSEQTMQTIWWMALLTSKTPHCLHQYLLSEYVDLLQLLPTDLNSSATSEKKHG